jgi:hypothetical protein
MFCHYRVVGMLKLELEKASAWLILDDRPKIDILKSQCYPKPLSFGEFHAF